MAQRVSILLGTRKGAFILDSDASRKEWQVRGPIARPGPSTT